jgi:hypothetical protein
MKRKVSPPQKRQVSTARQPWLRTAIYSFMTLTVTVIVALLLLIVLGYSFNQKDGKLEQGGLLQFQSIPTGATVTLDEMKLSALTNTKATADSGSHFASFDKDNYRTWQKAITVVPGQIGWLSYARLIPKTITPQTLHSFTTLTGALSTNSRNYMILHEEADKPEFTLVNIQGDTVRYDALVLPTTVFTAPAAGKTQSFTLDGWSDNDDAILVRHTYDDTKTEWILLDRSSPEKSININATYGINPLTVQFAGGGSKLLFVQTDDIVRRINLNDQTLSRPLATRVANFTIYDDKTIVFVTSADEKAQRSVGYAATDIDQPVTIATYPADGLPLYAGITNYFSQKYVAVMHGQTLTIHAGALPTADNKGTLKKFTSQTLPVGASHLQISRNNRFVVVTLADGYATYDIELRKFDKTVWATQSTTPRVLNWLDDYMLWSDNGGQLRFYEFDGANQQNIMPVAEGFAASLSANNKYIYGIFKTDKGFELRRAQLVLS